MEKDNTQKTKKPAGPTGKQGHSPVPAKIISGRKIILGLVFIAIAFMLFPTIRLSLSKIHEVSEMEKTVASQEQEHSDLSRQILRWRDENYIKQQARDRVNMVMPGETAYWVTGEGLEDKENDSAKQKSESEKIWLDRLTESFGN